MDYLEDYLQRLRDVQSPDEIYSRLAQWQFDAFNSGQQAQTVENLNLTFKFGLSSPYQLQANHLPTTAVGNLSSLVIVSANPGYRSEVNRLEHKWRMSSAAHNAEFCRSLFDVYPKALGGSTVRYWSFAIGLWKEAFLNPNDERMRLAGRSMWQEAHRSNWSIGGLDLCPFHSSKDGITSRLHLPDAKPLLAIAEESLRLICRMPQSRSLDNIVPRRLILVASARGQKLVGGLAEEGTLKLVDAAFGPPQWKLMLWEGTHGNLVLSTSYQLLSRMPRGCKRIDLARLIRQAVDLPY